MDKLINSLLKKVPKKFVRMIADNPAITLGAGSILVTMLTGFIKSKSIQEGYLSNIKPHNNYGSYNGGRVQYLEEVTDDTVKRDQKHPEFRQKVEEGCRKDTLEANLSKAKRR